MQKSKLQLYVQLLPLPIHQNLLLSSPQKIIVTIPKDIGYEQLRKYFKWQIQRHKLDFKYFDIIVPLGKNMVVLEDNFEEYKRQAEYDRDCRVLVVKEFEEHQHFMGMQVEEEVREEQAYSDLWESQQKQKGESSFYAAVRDKNILPRWKHKRILVPDKIKTQFSIQIPPKSQILFQGGIQIEISNISSQLFNSSQQNLSLAQKMGLIRPQYG